MIDKKKHIFSGNIASTCNYWGSVVLLLGAIYHYCTIPAKSVKLYGYNDKLVHFATYTVLAFLLVRAWYYQFAKHKNGKWILGMWACSAIAGLYGAIIEVCQLYCGRHFEWEDILANTLGAVAGAVFYYLIHKGDYYGSEPCK